MPDNDTLAGELTLPVDDCVAKFDSAGDVFVVKSRLTVQSLQ